MGTTSAVCENLNFSSATANVGSSTISNLSPNTSGLVVGELVSGSGSNTTGTIQVQPGTEIASISNTKVTVTLPLTGSATSTVTFSVSFIGDNHGTLIVDAGGDCYQKTNYRGDPHEWGAKGDGITDDTAAMQEWLGAYGNVSSSLAPGTAPANFGPYIASMPGTYLVSQPLSCPANATIQGYSNLDNQKNPRFQIIASPAFSGLLQGTDPAYPVKTQAVIGAHDFCRLSGVGITASQPLPIKGVTTSGSTTICVANITGVNLGDAVISGNTPPDIPRGAYVASFPTSGCSGTVPVGISAAATGTNTETISFSSPIILSGTLTMGSTTITNLNSDSGINIGNAITDPNNYIPAYSTVAAVSSGSCPCSVTFANPSGTGATTTATESITFWGPDAVDALGLRVAIDGFSWLSGGRYNLDCGDNPPASGKADGDLALKDSNLAASTSDNVYVPANCPNIRLIGDIFANAGNGWSTTARGVFFGDDEFTIANGVIEESAGTGLDLTGGHRASVSAMHIQGNGGPGIVLDNSYEISICGNHLEGNNASGSAAAQAHIYLKDSPYDINLCGNVYETQSTGPNGASEPAYVYDADPLASLAHFGLYENPESQVLGVLSPNAASKLPQYQELPGARAFLTGLTLSNDVPATNSTVDIAPGVATDSTGVALIQNASGCKVDLTTNGLNGLDSGSMATSTTYFFFVVADQAPVTTGAGTATPSCMASTNLAPNFPANTHYGAPIYRLVGALYTTTTTPANLIQFYQDGDTFYLGSSITDIKTATPQICAPLIGTAPQSCALSVPCGRNAATCMGFKVEAFGRVVGGGNLGGALLLSSLDQGVQLPANFPTAPGYSTSSPAPNTAFPFKVYTDGGGRVRVQASTSANNAYEVTDGWVWRRQQ